MRARPNAIARRGLRRLAQAGLLGAGMLVAHAAWLPAKAALAQVLLERAWQRALEDGERHAPWPWADVAPVARLDAPRLGVAQVVLRGDNGRSLAFAPGWSESSAAPGEAGTSVVSAHRDTHFRFLRDLVVGDALVVETTHGLRDYRVASLRVADARSERLSIDDAADRLLLVTCYPFDALDARGPMRYVVEAIPFAATRVRDQRVTGTSPGGGAAGARARGPAPSPSIARPGRGGRAVLAFQPM